MDNDHIQSLLKSFSATPAALAELFDTAAPELLAIACHLVRDDALAEDVLQNAFVAVIESIERYDPRQSGSGWLVGIVTNESRYRLRQARRTLPRSKLEVEPQEQGDEPIRLAIRAEEGDALHVAVDSLPARYRSVVSLALAGIASPAEIAHRLGRNVAAVRVQLHRGIRMLRRVLPAGTAIGTGLLVIEKESLAGVKSVVMARSAAVAKGSLFGGAGMMVKCAALLGACGVAATVILHASRADSVPPMPTSPGGIVVAEAMGAEFAEPPSPAQDLGANRRTESSSSRAPVSEGGTAMDELGSIVDLTVREPVGIDLETGATVPPAEADVVVVPGGRIELGKGIEFADLDDRGFSGDLETASRAAIVSAVTGFQRQKLHWRSGGSASDSIAFVRTRDQRVFMCAFVDNRRRDGGFESRIFLRRVPAAPEPPANPRADTTHSNEASRESPAGVVLDRSRLSPDPVGVEIASRERALLSEIDAAAHAYEAAGAAPVGWKIRGCAFREFAARVSMNRYFDYVASTYSFELDTRDDVKATHNDWDVAFENDGDPRLRIRLVTDDRSRVFDLGDTIGDIVDPESLATAESSDRDLPIAAQHTYLIRSQDTDEDRIDLLRIVGLRDDRYVIFAWLPVYDGRSHEPGNAMVEGILAAIDAPKKRIENGTVHVQMRGGAGGGNPNEVFLDGSKNAYVDEIVATPIDLSGAIADHERHRAFVDGGVIPRDKLWRVTCVRYNATTDGDFNGPGGFRVEIGGTTIVEAATSITPTQGVWNGEIVLKPGDESKSFVEILNSSRCDVTIEGEMIAARTASKP